MKRTELLRKIGEAGGVLIRRGGKHDWYRNPDTGVSQPVPRHREIKDRLAVHILRQLRSPSDPLTSKPDQSRGAGRHDR